MTRDTNRNKTRRRLWPLSVLVILSVIALSGSASRASKEECVEFVGKAVDYFKAQGAQKALAEFNNPKGAFIDRDLYIVAYDENGVTLAHGHNPALVGKDRLDEQDADGVFYNRRRVELAQTDANFWLFYKFTDPLTKKLLPKATYCETASDAATNKKFVICSGTYGEPKRSTIQ